MSQVGPAGQRKLKNSRVLVVGAGGLGGPVSIYLALAGVGTIGIVGPRGEGGGAPSPGPGPGAHGPWGPMASYSI